jgi:hypothetical protein
VSIVGPARPVITHPAPAEQTAAAYALFAPILDTLAATRARHGDGPVHGLAPDLLAPAAPARPAPDNRPLPGNWPATDLAVPPGLDALLDAAARRWSARPPAAAALAWKAYTYWLLLPAVLGYASARRIPLLDAGNVAVHIDPTAAPLLTIGLRAAAVTVLATDPLAVTASPAVRVVADEADLLAEFRRTVFDAHLAPLLTALAGRTHVGRRTLLGSVASAIGHALIRASDSLPGSIVATAEQLLSALAVADLVELRADPSGALAVQRKTCCLAFTLPEPKICRGCCIT